MLRGKNMWVDEFHGEISWTWRKLMKMGDVVWSFLKHRIGNCRETYMWLDNWHPCGP